MISKEKKLKLIAIYLYICDLYEKEIRFTCQQFSNNANPLFTDQEIITIYLFVVSEQHHAQVKEIYCFAKDYLLSWFPKILSYQAFNARVNLLSEAFKTLVVSLLDSFKTDDCSNIISIVNSMPIITCSAKNRIGKVAPEITSKGYCSSKNMYYYECKLHALNFQRRKTIPFPESLIITNAAENDLSVFKLSWGVQLLLDLSLEIKYTKIRYILTL